MMTAPFLSSTPNTFQNWICKSMASTRRDWKPTSQCSIPRSSKRWSVSKNSKSCLSRESMNKRHRIRLTNQSRRIIKGDSARRRRNNRSASKRRNLRLILQRIVTLSLILRRRSSSKVRIRRLKSRMPRMMNKTPQARSHVVPPSVLTKSSKIVFRCSGKGLTPSTYIPNSTNIKALRTASYQTFLKTGFRRSKRKVKGPSRRARSRARTSSPARRISSTSSRLRHKLRHLLLIPSCRQGLVAHFHLMARCRCITTS